MPQENNWFVFYTKSRAEKKVYDRLMQHGYETFLPLRRTRKQWHDRVKWVEEPLISSYIFVRTMPKKIPNVLQVSGIVSYVRYCSKPAVVRPSEIDFLKRMHISSVDAEMTNQVIPVNSRVLIENGPFCGMECRVTEVSGKFKLVVQLKEIHYNILIDIKNSIVKRLD